MRRIVCQVDEFAWVFLQVEEFLSLLPESPMGEAPVVGADGFSAAATNCEDKVFAPVLCFRILEKRFQTCAVEVVWRSELCEFGNGRIEIKQFGEVPVAAPWVSSIQGTERIKGMRVDSSKRCCF